jgi:hypothetical protein
MPAPTLHRAPLNATPGPSSTATLVRGLPAPGPTQEASAAVNKIVRFLRNSGLPAPTPAQGSALAAGLARISQIARVLLRRSAIGLVTMLGGDTRQMAPGTQLLARLVQGRANLDQTFEALDGLVTQSTAWPDIHGQRAALQLLLTNSRQQIQALATRKPEQAARQLAALFELFELRADGASSADPGRLAVARGILARSGLAQPPQGPNPTPARPAPAAAIAPVRAPAPEVEAARQATQAATALHRPLPSAQGAAAVQALRKAIRAYDAAPGQRSPRINLNNALALARSLKHTGGSDWTPATRKNFDAFEHQAQDRLYSDAAPPSRPAGPPLPGQTATSARPPSPLRAPGTRVTHTSSDIGTTAQIEARRLAQVAQRLQEATEAYYDRIKTLLPGGNEAALAEQVHEEMGLRALGVSLDQFQAYLRAGQTPQGADGARASVGSTSGAPGLSPGGLTSLARFPELDPSALLDPPVLSNELTLLWDLTTSKLLTFLVTNTLMSVSEPTYLRALQLPSSHPREERRSWKGRFDLIF